MGVCRGKYGCESEGIHCVVRRSVFLLPLSVQLPSLTESIGLSDVLVINVDPASIPQNLLAVSCL